MTLLLMDGFDYCNDTTGMSAKGFNFNQVKGSYSGGPSVGIAAGRNVGSRAIQMSTGLSGGGTNTPTWYLVSKALPSAQAEVIMGCASNIASNPDGGLKHILMMGTAQPSNGAGTSAGSTNAVAWVSYDMTTGRFSICNGSYVVLATGTAVVSAGSWCYLEWRVKVNGAASEIELRVNGLLDIATTVVNLGSVNISHISVGATSPWGGNLTQTATHDDLYVLTKAGAAPRNNFLGPCRIETLVPDGEGTTLNWVPSAGTAHFSLVDEIGSGTYPNGDTDYVSTANLGDKDTYNYGPLASPSGQVFAVQVNASARKDDIPARKLCSVVRQAGADTDGPDMAALNTSYAYGSTIWEQDPAAADWTIAKVNAAEFGIKVTL